MSPAILFGLIAAIIGQDAPSTAGSRPGPAIVTPPEATPRPQPPATVAPTTNPDRPPGAGSPEANKVPIENQSRLFEELLKAEREHSARLILSQAESSQRILDVSSHLLNAQRDSEAKALKLLRDSEDRTFSLMDKIQANIANVMGWFQLFLLFITIVTTIAIPVVGNYIHKRIETLSLTQQELVKSEQKLFAEDRAIEKKIATAHAEHRRLFSRQKKVRKKYAALKKAIMKLEENSKSLEGWQIDVRNKQRDIEAQSTIMLLRSAIEMDRNDEAELRRLAGELSKSPSVHAFEYWVRCLQPDSLSILKDFALEGFKRNPIYATRNIKHYELVGAIIINGPDGLRQKAIDTLLKLAIDGTERKRPSVIEFMRTLTTKTEDSELRGRIEGALLAAEAAAKRPDPSVSGTDVAGGA